MLSNDAKVRRRFLVSADQRFLDVLVKQVVAGRALFFIGAGLSRNWSCPSGKELGQWIVDRIHSGFPELLDVDTVRDAAKNPENLPIVAESLARPKCWFLQKVLWRPESPPAQAFLQPALSLAAGSPVHENRIGVPHVFLGRLAKERLITDVITTNYDCLLEAGCLAVGMVEERDGATILFDQWPESFAVTASKEDAHHNTRRQNTLSLLKLHGCIGRVGEQVSRASSEHCTFRCELEQSCTSSLKTSNLVITQTDINSWRDDGWARDIMHDRLRSSHTVIVGFGGEDPVLNDTFQRIASELPAGREAIRMQAVTLAIRAPLESILDRANHRNHAAPGGAVYQPHAETARADLESLFGDVYVHATKAKVSEIVRAYGQTAFAQGHAQPGDVIDRILNGISSMAPHAWYHSLAAAMRTTWLLNNVPLLAVAAGQQEDLVDRIKRPDYYVPMASTTRASDITKLAAFYSGLCEVAARRNLTWLDEGWVALRSDRHLYVILPVVADSVSKAVASLDQVARTWTAPAGLANDPYVRVRIAVITGHHGHGEIEFQRPTSGLRGANVKAVELGMSLLLDNRSFGDWVAMLLGPEEAVA